jgi:hydroxyacylglutathione hydrolase
MHKIDNSVIGDKILYFRLLISYISIVPCGFFSLQYRREVIDLKIIHQQKNVTVYQSAIYMTNSIVIETPELVLVVDPNWLPQEVEKLRHHADWVQGDRELYLLFTHSDYDHIIGYGAFPTPRVIASRQLQEQPEHSKESILEDIRQFDDDYYIVRPYPIAYPQVDIAIEEDGHVLEVGSTRMTFYLALGHTSDGLITVIDPGGIIIVGDYLSDIEFPYIYHSSTEYMNTLAKINSIINKHNPQLLIPGHGSVAENQVEMQRRRLASEHYIVNMRHAVIDNDQTAMDGLIADCPFPRNMRQYQESNRKLLLEELHLKRINDSTQAPLGNDC